MLATILVLTVIAAAGGIGWGVYRLSPRLKTRLGRVGLSVFAAMATLTLSATVLLVLGGTHYASDDSIFESRSTYDLQLYAHGGSHHPVVEFAVSFPDAVPANDENAIDLTVRGSIQDLNEFQAALRVSTSVEARPTGACSSDSSSGAVLSCVDKAAAIRGSPFRWIIRSPQPGRLFATISLPREAVALATSNVAWLGVVKRDNLVLTPRGGRECGPRTDMRPRRTSCDRPLSVSNPVLRSFGAEIDMRTAAITIPVDFETTLGVTGGTYQILGMMAAILSTMLGGGWGWQVVAAIRRKASR